MGHDKNNITLLIYYKVQIHCSKLLQYFVSYISSKEPNNTSLIYQPLPPPHIHTYTYTTPHPVYN